jgi:hypothetical protein
MQVIVASLSRNGKDLTHILALASTGTTTSIGAFQVPVCILPVPPAIQHEAPLMLKLHVRPVDEPDVMLMRDQTLPHAVLELTCTTLKAIQSVLNSIFLNVW